MPARRALSQPGQVRDAEPDPLRQPVDPRIGAGDADGLGIMVEGLDRLVAEPGGAERQDSGAGP